ncbi:MAG: hypothetical protein VZR95_09505 [Alphaproteobacteria bacterium]
MINNDRIVPIQSMDFLSMVGTILAINGTSYTVVASTDVQGTFEITGTGDVGNVLANQPVQTMDFASGVTAGVVYFVPDYNFSGISISGTAVDLSAVTIDADGISLYTATLASGAVTVAKITPDAPQA